VQSVAPKLSWKTTNISEIYLVSIIRVSVGNDCKSVIAFTCICRWMQCLVLIRTPGNKRAVSDWVGRTLTLDVVPCCSTWRMVPFLLTHLYLHVPDYSRIFSFIHHWSFKSYINKKEPWHFHSNPPSNVTSQRKYW
jgi:hypothetical protein